MSIKGMEFVQIPGGSFLMGSNDEPHESPAHLVHVKRFLMQTTPVTQAQWDSVMGNNPSFWKGDNLPVEMVCWGDAQAFIQKLNQMDPGKDYRLPSEAEWEYACRAGTTTKYNTGSNESDLARAGWYSGNSGGTTHPVSQKTPNDWGLYDMHGNVREWCQDYHHDNYDGAPTDGSSWERPTPYRVQRGGSSYKKDLCHSSARKREYPGKHISYFGFRLVCR